MNRISIISTELITPSSPSIHHRLHFKLSLLDQLFPVTYVPIIFFYPTNNNQNFISTRLKKSLSQTLSTFYPLSGRLKNNSFIDSYQKGAPYIETRVKGNLFDFLKQPQLNLLNKFLPCQPLGYHSDPEATPQVAIQVNTFDCGGIALGLCFSHKIIDVATAIAFLDCWTANARAAGSFHENAVNPPALFEASSRFPTENELLVQIPLWVKEKNLFKNGNITKRFIFDADAIATLRAKAKSQRVPNPSRTETLSAFIWKSCTEACRLLSSSPRPSASLHAVNIRQRAKPCFSRYSIGNLWWLSIASCELADTEIELKDLVSLTRESFTEINYEYLKAFQGERGLPGTFETSLVKRMVEIGLRNPEVFYFSSWLQFDLLNDADFGWGKPIWVGLAGEVGRPGWTNIIFFKETGRNNEIEVWMTLNGKIMSLVESNPEFLQFCTPNPSIFIPSVLN